MVYSQLNGCSGPLAHKLLRENLLRPLESLNIVISSELEKYDLDDVFGPVTTLPPLKLNPVNLGNDAPLSELNKIGYDVPVDVIPTRSHSLIGPTPCVSKSLEISKLAHYEYMVPEKCEELDEGSEDCLKKFSDDDEPLVTESRAVGLEDFEVLKLVGQGAFGKVFQVKKKGTSEIYAMKVMRKDKIMKKKQAEYMKTERDILATIDHPFIVRLRYSFQTKYRLYLVLDFVNGGDLYFQLYKHGLFREDLARFYAAEVVSAVSHLHANGIMHRDLKPENILLDADGHVMLTDFGLAKQFDEHTRSNSMCGTTEYMAPEIILAKGHDKAADWWSVGVLLFEMLTGKPPFIGDNRVKIQQKIVQNKIKMPAYLCSEAHSLLKSLLQKDPSKRLGSGPGGSEEIKKHKWFKYINWKKLDARQIQPSFRPSVSGELDIANFEEKWTEMPLSESPVASPVGHDCAFRGFSFVRPPAPLLDQEI